ncbi:MAG: hypothetical protein NXI15_04230 [Gammaproteobacteria bacterium]|nr:hypothetical protein [Gammaproteobacteria bacterium]
MPSPKDLEKALIESSEILVECCSLISDIPFESEEKNIYRIGKAIAEINEVRSDLYEKCPHLKPEGWGEKPTQRQLEEWLENAIEIADEHLNQGNPAKAIEVYNSYIFIGPPSELTKTAEGKISEIRSAHGI